MAVLELSLGDVGTFTYQPRLLDALDKEQTELVLKCMPKTQVFKRGRQPRAKKHFWRSLP